MPADEDEKYVCTLTEASLERARKELNEDPKDRLAAIKALREWILQQPHLHVRTGRFFQLACSVIIIIMIIINMIIIINI